MNLKVTQIKMIQMEQYLQIIKYKLSLDQYL